MHDRQTPPEGFDAEETPTGVSCLACGGEYRSLEERGSGYRMRACRWCSAGMMTPAQVTAWKARKSQPR